jgi:hypothetical protein
VARQVSETREGSVSIFTLEHTSNPDRRSGAANSQCDSIEAGSMDIKPLNEVFQEGRTWFTSPGFSVREPCLAILGTLIGTRRMCGESRERTLRVYTKAKYIQAGVLTIWPGSDIDLRRTR